MPVDLIHLIDSPFRSKKTKYFTVIGAERIFDLLISQQFYPTILPVYGTLISLTVTTQNLVNKFDSIQKSFNKIITANLCPTKEENNFVTHGNFSIYDVSDEVYEVYLEAMNFNIISDPPTIIKKNIEGKEHTIIIGKSRHFQWINYSQYGKETIDVSFNIILVNFPKDNIRYPSYTRIKFNGKELNVVSTFGKVLVPEKDGNFKFESVNLLFEKSLYNKISENELFSFILQVYTLYNMKDGDRDSPPINFVTAVIPFFGSFEEIIPFICNSYSVEGLFKKCIIEKKKLEKLRSQALEGNPESNIDIHEESKISSLKQHSDQYEYIILRTNSVLKFIRGAISDDYGRSLIESTLSSKNMHEKIQELLNQLKKGPFINGSFINPGLKNAIITSFQD